MISNSGVSARCRASRNPVVERPANRQRSNAFFLTDAIDQRLGDKDALASAQHRNLKFIRTKKRRVHRGGWSHGPRTLESLF